MDDPLEQRRAAQGTAPPTDEGRGTAQRPSAEDAAARLVVLRHVVLYALTAPQRDALANLMAGWDEERREEARQTADASRESFWRGIRSAGLWERLSPKERAFADTTPVTMTARQQADASWRMEAVQVLMWALGLLPRLPAHGVMASHDILRCVPARGPAAFLRSAALREQAGIDRERDVAELWHWRSRTRRLVERGDALPPGSRAPGFGTLDGIVRFTARRAAAEGAILLSRDDDFLAMGKPYRDLTPEEWSKVRSVTVERHFALNWLCGYAPGNRWDETPTDT